MGTHKGLFKRYVTDILPKAGAGESMEVAIYFTYFLFVFIFGICIGSFLNVIIYRVPNKLDFVHGRSFCPKCGHMLAVRDLVPLFSFIVLGGHCRYCREKISFRYPMIEALCGCLFLWCVWELGFTLSALAACILAAVLLALAMIDWDTMTIPDGLIIALLIPCVLSLFTAGTDIWSRLIGFFVVSVPLLALALLIPGSFGFGDVELMAVCGFFLGWQNVLLALFIGIVLGGVAGVFIMARHSKSRPENSPQDNKQTPQEKEEEKHPHMPFGPYLAIGVFIAMLYGDKIIRWYLSFLGF